MKSLLYILVMLVTFAGFSYARGDKRDLESCRTLIDRGEVDEARKKLVDYRRTNPDDPESIFLLARIEPDMETSAALYLEAELFAAGMGVVKPDSTLAAEALFQRSEIVFSGMDVKEAAPLYQRLVTVYPGNAHYYDAVYRLGMINLISGEPKKALEKFRTCHDKSENPENRALAATGIMECFVQLKDWPEVLAAARQVLDETDENGAVTPRVLEVTAEAWRQLGNEINAAWYTDRLLTTYPDSYHAHAVREKAYAITGSADLTVETPAVQDSAGASVWEEPVRGSEETPVTSADTIREPAAPQNGNGGFSIQAGAFRDRINARKLYEKLNAARFDVRIEMKDVNGIHFYKVLVGRYGSREDAEKAVSSVERTTGERASVIIVE